MKVLIIEDEPQAAKRIESLLKEIDPAILIVGKTDSVKQSVAWLNENESPDLILMDIQLGDGLSFEIFEKTTVYAPAIFTTAYDEYALKAFKVNSIDYILKPIDKAELILALQKFESIKGTSSSADILKNIEQVVHSLTKKHKERFVIKVGEHLRTVETSDILFFYSKDKTTFGHTQESRDFILDYTLEQVERLVNPDHFYRINRKYLIRSSAIKDIITYSNSRLQIKLKAWDDNDVIVARERVQEFRQWLDR